MITFPFSSFSEHKSTTMKEHLKFLLQLKEFIIALQKCFRGNLAQMSFPLESLVLSNKKLL